MWYAGLDWADSHHDVVVIDDGGRQVASRRVAHSAQGLAELTAFLRQIAPLDQIACIVETNQGLLISTLLEAGCTLYPVNPKTIDRRATLPEPRRTLLMPTCWRKQGQVNCRI